MTTKTELNVFSLYMALDEKRKGDGLTWKQVATESGVHASTLTRMAQGKRPDADGLAALLRWLDIDIKHFTSPPPYTASGVDKPNTLALVSALFRADRTLSQEGAEALDKLVRATYAHLSKGKGQGKKR